MGVGWGLALVVDLAKNIGTYILSQAPRIVEKGGAPPTFTHFY